MIPNTTVSKVDGATGVVQPGSRGIIAIIAPCEKGPTTPAAHTKVRNVLTSYGYGVLSDFAAAILPSGNPVVCLRATASTAATAAAVTHTGAGTSVATVSTPSAILDDFKVKITFKAGGTIGVAGITYTYSLDGGVTESAVQALGTATSIAIPNSGVTIALAAGTILANQTEETTTTGPRLTTGDITTALEALRTSALPWEFVLVAGHDATSTTVSTIDSWLQAREAEGRYRGFLVNGAMKGSASEATYLTSLTTAWSGVASIRGCVGADGGDLASVLPGRGITQVRPTSLALAARVAKVSYGTDPSYVGDGPVNGFDLPDSAGNPKNHDENFFPGPDALRLVTLRTFDRKAGTFITNANVISSSGSDYVWVQHIRTMNRACEIAFDVLRDILSKGVNKSPKVGPNGEVYIDPADAQKIDDLVNAALNELRSEVSDLRFVLSRTDDIGANGPITLNADLQVVAKAYVKGFNVAASFARSISVQG